MAVNYVADTVKLANGNTVYLNHYKSGATVSASNMALIIPGVLSNGADTMTFSMPLSKNASGLAVQITSLKGNIRGISGGGYYYGETSDEMSWTSGGNDFTARVKYSRVEFDGAYLTFAIKPTSGKWKTGNGASTTPTNNTPVVFEIDTLNLSFT